MSASGEVSTIKDPGFLLEYRPKDVPEHPPRYVCICHPFDGKGLWVPILTRNVGEAQFGQPEQLLKLQDVLPFPTVMVPAVKNHLTGYVYDTRFGEPRDTDADIKRPS